MTSAHRPAVTRHRTRNRPPGQAVPSRAGPTPSVAAYDHDGGGAITGGYLYRGDRHPELRGAYRYGDYCSGRLWALARDAGGRWTAPEQPHLDARISSFGAGLAGPPDGLLDGLRSPSVNVYRTT